MRQVFPPSANFLAKLSVLLFLGGVTGLGIGIYLLSNSSYNTDKDTAVPQPVAFSHKHHVNGLGLDCRFCHASVENSSTAGMPSTSVCMSCHSQIWATSPELAAVRKSFDDHTPLAWNRVHALPDYVYFNHSIHIHKGVACFSCHGRVDQMALEAKVHDIKMSWCLDCHAQPSAHLVAAGEVFNMPPWPQGARPVRDSHYGLVSAPISGPKTDFELRKSNRLLNCYTCHR